MGCVSGNESGGTNPVEIANLCTSRYSESDSGFEPRPALVSRERRASSPAAPRCRARDVSFAVDHHVYRIGSRGIHSRKIGVLRENNAAGARILIKIFLDRFFGFANVDGENSQILI
jgi:hypothetical protein